MDKMDKAEWIFRYPFPWTHYFAMAALLLTWVIAYYSATWAVEAVASAWRRRGYRKQWAKLTESVRIPAPRPYPPIAHADMRVRAVR